MSDAVATLVATGARGPVEITIDARDAARVASHAWRCIGGRVVAIGDGDDFSTLVDLAGLVAGVPSARASRPGSRDYRAAALVLPCWQPEPECA